MVDPRVLPALPRDAPVAVVAWILPLHAAVYGSLAAIVHPSLATFVAAVISWMAGLLTLRFPSARHGSFLVCIATAIVIFPDVPNHGYVLCLALGANSFFGVHAADERRALTQNFRYLAAIVLFWSGVQKVWAGTWTQGQFLSYEIGHSPRFGEFFAWLTTRVEQRAYRTSGPFLTHGTLSFASNLLWIAEIILGLALLSTRDVWQKRAAFATLLLLVGVEIIARESVFGLLMAGLLWPTLETRFSLRWLWLVVPIELLALGGRLSLVSGGFH
jgi:hypothetical protein